MENSSESYYVPAQSHWPIIGAVGLTSTLGGGALILHSMQQGQASLFSQIVLISGVLILAGMMFGWFASVVAETRKGLYSPQLDISFRMGMSWFIFSEVMFFAAFFGALWYVRNLAGPWLGGESDAGRFNYLLWESFSYEWPMMETPQDAVGGVSGQITANNGVMTGPERNMSFPGWNNIFHWLPLWNTVILMSSSVTAHIAHLALLAGNRKKQNIWLGITVALGMIFVYLQYLEYHEAYVDYGLFLSSGIYGSTFFMLTGFHGFHVCMGAFMLLVQWLRSTRGGHFTKEDHFGFEASSWYWHFVDVVWVGLFLFVYII